MKSFGYLKDPLFRCGCVLYGLNRWGVKPHVQNPFLRFHFNDLLLIPCALPPFLLLLKWLRLRPEEDPPRVGETLLYLVVWSILFEMIGPKIMPRAVGDVWDVVVYFLGAVVALVWWRSGVVAAGGEGEGLAAWPRRPARVAPPLLDPLLRRGGREEKGRTVLEMGGGAGPPWAGFDWMAKHYQWIETLVAGGLLQQCRTEFLDRVKGCRNVLILGEGNGRFLAELRRVLPEASITCVDASSRMLDETSTRLQRSGLGTKGIELVQADALAWAPPRGEYDLIVTHFFLDCFRPEQLQALLAKLGSAASPRARWLISDFSVPAKGFARFRAEVIHALMYLFFKLTTALPASRLTPCDAYLEAAGFRLEDRREREWGLLRCDSWRRSP